MNVALVDTSAYLNLARCLHPILGRHFGPPPWTAQAIAELEREFAGKGSLAASHYWFTDASYAGNREGNKFVWTSVDIGKAKRWTSNIVQYCRANGRRFKDAGATVPSPADCVLAGYAATLTEAGMPAAVITDDRGLHLAIKDLESSVVMHGYEMLAYCLAEGQVALAQVKALYGELAYMTSLPGTWRNACQATFGFAPP